MPPGGPDSILMGHGHAHVRPPESPLAPNDLYLIVDHARRRPCEAHVNVPMPPAADKEKARSSVERVCFQKGSR